MALRNLHKFISSASLAAKNHNFILSTYGKRFSPASYYFNPNERNLQSGHPHDPFTLSLIAYELTRENASLRESLEKNERFESLKAEILDKIEENNQFIESFSKEISLQLRTKAFDFPVETCSNVIYVCENNNNSQRELYESCLFPIIKAKLNYMSFHGLANLINGLVSSKSFSDKQLLKMVLDRLKEKLQEANNREYVETFGWKLDRFQTSQKKSETKAEFVQYAQEGKNSFVANFKHWLRVSYSSLENFLLFKVFYRENRVARQFGEVSEQLIRETLRQDLEKLQNADNSVKVNELIELLSRN